MEVLVIPLFLAGALLAGAAYAAYQIIRQHRQKKRDEERRQQEQEDAQRRRAQSGVNEQPSIEKIVFDPIRSKDQALEDLVRATTFTSRQMIVGEKIVGIEEVPSQIPADDIMIRPMNGMGELPRVLPKAQMLPDDMFYAQAAAGQLPVTEHIEHVSLTEPVWGKSRKVLIVVQDISMSMQEHNRIRWAIRLNERLIDRCSKEDAAYVLLPFSGAPESPRTARNEPERGELRRGLTRVLGLSPTGTNIDAALAAALSHLEEQEYDEIRILLVTDGTEGVSGLTVERLKKSGAFLHTVVINPQHDMLQSISNRYDELRD